MRPQSLVERLSNYCPARAAGPDRIDIRDSRGHWHPIRRQANGHWRTVIYSSETALIDQVTGVFAEFDTPVHIPNVPRKESRRRA